MFLCAWVLLGFAAGQSLDAEVFIKMKHRTDAFEVMGMQQPAVDFVSEIWMAKDMLRSDSQGTSTLLRLDKNAMYMIDHARKSYVEVPLDQSPVQPGLSESEGMKFDIKITETNEKKKIGDWNCQKYLQVIDFGMEPMKAEIWATEDLSIDKDLYARQASAMFGKGPAPSSEDMMKELKKIKGVHVLTVSTVDMMGTQVKTTQELIEFKESKAPEDHFEIPSSYKARKPSDMMQGMPVMEEE